MVTIARDLLVHDKAPFEADSVESLGSLGAHHVPSHAVQVDMFGVDSFPDGSVGSPVFSSSSPVGSEHVSQVAGQLHLLYEPAAVDLQLLEVFTIAQTGSECLKLLVTTRKFKYITCNEISGLTPAGLVGFSSVSPATSVDPLLQTSLIPPRIFLSSNFLSVNAINTADLTIY